MKDDPVAPRRLRDDPTLRSLDFAAEARDARTFDVEGLAIRLEGQLAAGALPRLDPTALSGMRGLVLGSLAGLAVGGLVGGATVAELMPSSERPATVAAVSVAPVAPVAPSAPVAPAPPPPSPARATTAREDQGEDALARPSPSPSPSSPTTPTTPTTPSSSSTVAAELALLERAEAARRTGRYDLAARELEAHRRRFPRGELAVEAELSLLSVRAALGDHPAVIKQARRLLRDSRFADRADDIRVVLDRSLAAP